MSRILLSGNNPFYITILGGMELLLSKAWTLFEADKRIEGFSLQTLKAYRLLVFSINWLF